MENKGNISMASADNVSSHYSRHERSTGNGTGWSNWNRQAPVIHKHFHYGGKGNNAGKMDGDDRESYRKRKQTHWDYAEQKHWDYAEKKSRKGKGKGKGKGSKGKGKGNKGKGKGYNRDWQNHPNYQSFMSKCNELFEQTDWGEDPQHEQVPDDQGEWEPAGDQSSNNVSSTEANGEYSEANEEYSDGDGEWPY